VFLDESALRAAPVIQGPHVVFYGGIAADYYHWLIESLVPLCALAPHLPAGTKLLLPESFDVMREDPRAALLPTHHAMLRDWGFGEMPHTVAAAPVCLVEEVFYLRNLNLESFPASVLRGARERVLKDLPAAPGGRRIYVRRPAGRRVDNAADIEAAVEKLGFTVHDMTGLSAAGQIALFREASVVIAPHGAELANLLFCAPGTRVIELSPDVQFRYFFAQLSDKLGLSHAVLPCASVTGNFDGDMHVDRASLLALLRLMQART
jgi:capsular polysaccharide biosynthesis protein